MALAPIRVGPVCRLRARWPRRLPTFFFGTENLRAQSVMTGALSVLIFAGLLTVVASGAHDPDADRRLRVRNPLRASNLR